MTRQQTQLTQAPFDRRDVAIKQKQEVYQGVFKMIKYRVQHALFSGGKSEVFEREVFERGDAAAAILYDPHRDLIGLVDQFRIGALDSEYGPWCLEVVAGMFEEHESVEELLRRELVEEAGIEQAELVPITHYFSTPGGCTERIHLFCALCDLRQAEGVYGLTHEHEDIRLLVLPSASVFEVMYTSRVNNAATLIALQWLQARHQDLRDTAKTY